jgi:hypothetical protein
MKLVKNFVFAVLLVSAIAVNTPAGEQETPGYAPPPPQRAMTAPDEDPTVLTDGGTTETSDNLIYEALAALLSVY